MDKEFTISLQYLDPKFYQKDKSDFLADCVYSRNLESLSLQKETLRRIKVSFNLETDTYDVNCVVDHSIFDPLFQMCSTFPKLDNSVKADLLTLLSDSIENLISQLTLVKADKKPLYQKSLKMLSFLICMAINLSEKVAKHDDGWDWDFEKEKVFGVLVSVLRCENVKKLWNLNTPEEAFGNMFFKTVLTLFETKKNLTRFSKDIFRMIALILNQNNYLLLTFSATFTHLILNKEKLAPKISDLCVFLVVEEKIPDVVGNIIREIGRLDDVNLSKNIKGSENLGIFLVEIAKRLPWAVYKNIDVLLRYLDGACYKMRNGVIEVIAELMINIKTITEENLTNLSLMKEKRKLCESGKPLEKNKKQKPDPKSQKSNDESDEQEFSADIGETEESILEDNVDKENLNQLDENKDIEGEKALNSENKDNENGENEKENLKKQKNEAEVLGDLQKLLELVEERTLDVVSYTRTKALRVLRNLVDQQAVPSPENFIHIVKICRKRLREKNANVRKSAVSLLTLMIIKNYPENPSVYKKRKEQLEEILKIVEKAESINDSDSNSKKLSEEANRKLTTEHESVTRACEFMSEIEKCFPIICEILVSKGNFDVIECINFFKEASARNIEGWKLGYKKMFSLIWNKENKNIIDSVIDAYYEKYLNFDKRINVSSKEKNLKIAFNLTKLISEMDSHKDLTCIDQIIVLMTKNEKIPQGVVKALINIFEMKVKQILELSAEENNSEESKKKLKFLYQLTNNSMFILSVIASVRPSLVESSLDSLISTVCESYDKIQSSNVKVEERFESVKHILSLVSKCKKANDEDQMEKIKTFVRKLIFSDSLNQHTWFPVIQQAITTLSSILPNPESFFEQTLREFFEEKNLEETLELSKFFFLLGNFALAILTQMESRERDLKGFKSRKDKIEMLIDSKRGKKNSVVADYYKMNEGEKEYQIEQMKERAEENLVKSDLLGEFGKLVLHVCRNLRFFNNVVLQRSAVLTFCKFNCISKSFCEYNLKLLFEIMENSSDSVLVTNIIVALGDIAFRFPNVTAPLISKMFTLLHHEDISVRKNTLLVVSHLILNDMIKVKESISEIALAITDSEKPVRDLAKLLFQEFSKKGKNPVYNTLPDIISKLTHDGVEKSAFEKILKELIRYVSEEKQQENLIVKICSRFSKIKDKEQIQNNTYCLTLLNYGEKCIKKLIEMSKSFQSLLGDEKVFELFRSIVSKAKKTAVKQEIKDQISEFEIKVMKIEKDKAHKNNIQNKKEDESSNEEKEGEDEE